MEDSKTKVWVVMVKCLDLNGRVGVKVFANKEDALKNLSELKSPNSHRDRTDTEEIIVTEEDGLIRLIQCDLMRHELSEMAVATECTVE